MKALLLEKPNFLKLIDIDRPVPGTNEVLVKIMACGICKSDVEALIGIRPMSITKYPVILGHEWSGVVEECGPGVTSVKVGDRVTAQGVVFCGYCRNCVRDLPTCCLNLSECLEYGFTLPGGFAEYINILERQLYKVPEELSFEEATLAEPASTVVNGLLRSGVAAGDKVAVIGPGPIGLLAVIFFKLYSPSQIIIIGTRDYRNNLALKLGATAAINLNKEDPREAVKHLTSGEGADICFEAAGNPEAVHLAMDIVAKGGTVILDGVAGDEANLEIPSDLFVLKGLTVSGILGYTRHSFRKAIELIALRQTDVKALITHTFPLSKYGEAFDVVMQRKEDPIKVILTP